MNRGRYIKHTRDEAAKIQKLRSMGLTWEVIQTRTGMTKNACRDVLRRFAV